MDSEQEQFDPPAGDDGNQHPPLANNMDSETFGIIQKDAGEFSKEFPKDRSEGNWNFPNGKERTPEHTIVVREATKIFEEVGIPITEHTVTNWCKPNKRGNVRLDCYYDEGDRKYFITPQSIDEAIVQELQGKGGISPAPLPLSEPGSKVSESVGSVQKDEPSSSEEVQKQPEDISGTQNPSTKSTHGQQGSDVNVTVVEALMSQLDSKDKQIEQLHILIRQAQDKIPQLQPPSTNGGNRHQGDHESEGAQGNND